MSNFDAYLEAIAGNKSFSDILSEKKLTPNELAKREEIAKAMEKDNPGMNMGKKMAIATSVAKKVTEEEDLEEAKNVKPLTPEQEKAAKSFWEKKAAANAAKAAAVAASRSKEVKEGLSMSKDSAEKLVGSVAKKSKGQIIPFHSHVVDKDGHTHTFGYDDASGKRNETHVVKGQLSQDTIKRHLNNIIKKHSVQEESELDERANDTSFNVDREMKASSNDQKKSGGYALKHRETGEHVRSFSDMKDAVKHHTSMDAANKAKYRIVKENADGSYEEINELSGKTYGDYINKAKHDIAKSGRTSGVHYAYDNKEKSNAEEDKIQKRTAGIGRAVGSLVKKAYEECENLDELSNDTLHSYIRKALPKIKQKAAEGDKDEVTNTAKGLGKALKKVSEDSDVNEAMLSYSDFKDKIDMYRKAGHKVVDDKYEHGKKATYTTIDQDGIGRKTTHTDKGVTREHLGQVKGEDEKVNKEAPKEKRGRGRPAGWTGTYQRKNKGE